MAPEVQERLEREDPSAVVGQSGVEGTGPTCEGAEKASLLGAARLAFELVR